MGDRASTENHERERLEPSRENEGMSRKEAYCENCQSHRPLVEHEPQTDNLQRIGDYLNIGRAQLDSEFSRPRKLKIVSSFSADRGDISARRYLESLLFRVAHDAAEVAAMMRETHTSGRVPAGPPPA
jgi:hypothetical protein